MIYLKLKIIYLKLIIIKLLPIFKFMSINLIINFLSLYLLHIHLLLI